MHRAALAQLPLWATFVQAFFPYIPTYACNEYHACESQGKRALPASGPNDPVVRDTEPGELLTFKLSQRSSPAKQDPAAAAARQADRLKRKYEFGGFVGFAATPASSKGSGKRDNTFSVMTAATPTATNSVGLDQDGSDISYFIEAKVGSGEESLYLLCDTGAGTTWIMGSDCSSTACGEHTTWDPSSSTSYKATGKDFEIAYGTGSVEGDLADDTISIGSVKVTMSFGVANTTSTDFEHFAFDGILGMSMANGASDNFMQTVKTDNVLSANIFSVDLNRASDGTNTGEITFGGTDPGRYTGDITYTSVDSAADGAWAIPIGNMGFNGNEAGVTDVLAYIDTGTTYAFGPSENVAALHALIPGSSSTDNVTFTAPCDTTLPITITFSGVSHEVSAKDWLSSPSSSDVCTSNIYGREVITGAFLLGDVFLKNVYTVFDADETRIGFATKANSTAQTTSSASGTTSTAGSTISAGSTATTTTGSTSAAAESAGATKTSVAVSASSGAGLQSRQYSSILCVVAVVAVMAL